MGGRRFSKPVDLFFQLLSGLGNLFKLFPANMRTQEFLTVQLFFLVLFFNLLVMKMGLTRWLCEVALSEGCQAVL